MQNIDVPDYFCDDILAQLLQKHPSRKHKNGNEKDEEQDHKFNQASMT